MIVTVSDNRMEKGPFEPLLPADKSLTHRALIAAYLAGEGCRLISPADNDDTRATEAALQSFSASEGSEITIDCGESASTLRLLLPLFAQSGRRIVFTGKGRLPDRPLGVYEKIYSIERTERGIEVLGTIRPGKFTIPGNVSSQFISGLLFLLPLLDGDSVIEILPPFESSGYVGMTLNMLETAGVKAEMQRNGTSAVISVWGKQTYKPFEYTVSADRSAAADLAALAFLTEKDIKLTGAEAGTAHPDRAIDGFLKELQKGPIEADISGCPDLGPLLFALAARTEGISRISGAARLRLKESDRIAAMQAELARLGCRMEAAADTVLVRGSTRIAGGVTLSSHGDHRIAMALSVLACAAESPVTIEGAECVSKSWPGFFEALRSCGVNVAVK